jgi:Glycosyltransferase family 87
LRALLVAIVASESAVIVGGSHLVGMPGLVLVLVATAAWALVVFDRRIEPRPRAVAIAIGVVFAIAVAVQPHGSRDTWSYVMSGRIVSTHHTNPYVHPPSDFPHDPFFGYVGTGWRHARSVYGPLFTGASAALTKFAGDSALRARLAFQGLAALSVVAALALIWRETRSSRALVFLGLHPAVVTAIVNGGHNDGLVGLAVLAGVIIVMRRRWYAAGFVLGLGMLCKASGALGLLGVVVWAARRARQGAAKMLLVATATTVLGYAPAGAVAVRAVSGAERGNTRASPWDLVRTLAHPSGAIVWTVVIVLVAVSAWRWRAAARPGTAATATIAAYLVGGAFVLPWYPAWALPTAALERRSFLGVLVAAHAAFLVAVYEFEAPAHPSLTGAWAFLRTTVIVMCAFAALAAAVTRLGRAPATEHQPHPPGFPLRP